jgi:LPXTG-motif cell wall-anchored protein
MNGSVPVKFTFNATGFDASTVVVFQSIYSGSDDLDGKGVLVAEHKDMEDEAEMIFYPGVETEASDGLTKNHTGVVSQEATVVDVVTYHNLIPGKEYTVSGVLMNKDTGEPVLDNEGNEITASSTFTAEEAEGTTELVYTLDSTLLSGKTVVVFEDLFHEGVRVAFHADIEDEDQSVHYPEIGTKASIDGGKSAQAGGTITLDDTVEYRNLVPGMEYTIVGVLMDRDAKNVLKVGGKDVTSKVTFTPESADGTVTVTFTFRASGLGGKTLVAFEYLYSNDEQVTCHADLDDEAQTVKLTTPPGGPPKTGDETNMVLWSLLAVMAFAAGCAVLFRNRRRRTR